MVPGRARKRAAHQGAGAGEHHALATTERGPGFYVQVQRDAGSAKMRLDERQHQIVTTCETHCKTIIELVDQNLLAVQKEHFVDAKQQTKTTVR